VNPLHGQGTFEECRTICNITSSRKYVSKHFHTIFSELSNTQWKRVKKPFMDGDSWFRAKPARRS